MILVIFPSTNAVSAPKNMQTLIAWGGSHRRLSNEPSRSDKKALT
jgi:hypothetical protein